MRYGHFSPDGLEYVVTRPDTPRPWYNRFGNPEYSVIISQAAGGYSIAGDSPRYQLTWYVPRYDEAGRYLYVRTEDGDWWNAGWGPSRRPLDRFECRHGLGWTTFTAKRGGIEAEMTVFVPLFGPVELWRVSLRNAGRKPRKVTAFPFVEWSIDSEAQTVDDLVYAATLDAEFEPETGAIVASRRDAANFRFHRGFLMTDVRPVSWDANRAAFTGAGRRLSDPAAVERGRCSNTPAEAEISVGAFSLSFRLAPGREASFHVMAGLAQTRGERAGLRRRFLARGAPEAALGAVRRFWREMPRTFEVRTPDREFDRFVNRWLVKHVWTQGSTRAVRSLSIGFRNHVQDSLGMLLLDPGRARALLCKAAEYVYASGDTAMQFHMGRGGAPTPPSHVDTKAWLALAVCEYARETGDTGLLALITPFVDRPRATTLLDKLMLIADKCWADRGRHGLLLVGRGDWNDNLSGMGRRGKGESVWMSEAALLVFAELAELMARLGRAREAAELRRRATTLRRAINAAGWDGDRYLMGFNDDGVAVGSRRSREVRLFLLPQAWAVLAGAASRQRGRRVLELVDRKLATDYGPTLTERPFTIPDPSIGRITFLARGMSENGPAYSHGSAFKACADALTGRGDALYGGLLQFLPYRHDPAVTLAEPFAICNFYRPKAIPRKYGATHRSWVTSTPNWALKAVGWGMMGVRPGYDGIEFDPAIPRAWKRCFVRRVIRGAVYEVAIENPRGRENGVRETWLNGVKQAGRRIPYLPGPGPHRVRVVLGTPPRRRA